jgi:hypothetical protein
VMRLVAAQHVHMQIAARFVGKVSGDQWGQLSTLDSASSESRPDPEREPG